MPLGEHRCEYLAGRSARRRRRGDLRDHLTGDAARHLVADPGIELVCPGEELPRQLGTLRTQRGQLEGARVTVQKASDKDVYRVRTAGMSREGAVATCERIKAAGGACFVAKN